MESKEREVKSSVKGERCKSAVRICAYVYSVALMYICSFCVCVSFVALSFSHTSMCA